MCPNAASTRGNPRRSSASTMRTWAGPTSRRHGDLEGVRHPRTRAASDGGLQQADLVRIVPERRRDAAAVEALIEQAFGPDRLSKTVYKLREGVKPVRELGFVAIDESD